MKIPMPRLLRKRASWLYAVAAFLFIFLFFQPRHRVLIIETIKENKLLLCFCFDEGEEFILYYTHSVNKRPVYDTIMVEADNLRVIRSRFDSFGAGMPHFEEKGTKLKRDDLGWIIFEPDYSLSDIKLFVGFTANHGIIVRGKNIPFLDFIEAGTSVKIRSSSFSLYSLWKKGCKK